MSKYFQKLRILEIKDETSDAYTLVLDTPEQSDFAYQAGQYLTVRVFHEGEEYRRAYSLSSCPYTDSQLSISIKRVKEGKVSNYLKDNLQEGDELEVMKPMGNFVIEPDPETPRHCIMVGAGSGITPLMSMIKAVLKEEPKSKVSLWYGNRTIDSIIFAKDLSNLLSLYPQRFHVFNVLSQADDSWKGAKGRLDQERVYKLLSDLFMSDDLRKEYYLCGPREMMDEAVAALDKHSVHPGYVNQEHFTANLPTDEELDALSAKEEETLSVSDGETEYEIVEQEVSIELEGETHTVVVSPKETILTAALAKKLDTPYTCMAGICTTCIAKLKSGLVSMDTTDGLTEEELEEGYILTCQAHPLDDSVEIEFE